MTKEQLQELIEQKGTVYDIDGLEIELYSKDKCHIVPKFDGMNDYLVVRYINSTQYFYIGQLMDKEHHEWRQRTVAERTERFEPPMWEDIKGYYRFNFMNCENGVWKKYSFELLKKQDDKAKEGGCISIWTGTKDIYNKTTPTKENYEKACEIVRDLFKGKNNGL